MNVARARLASFSVVLGLGCAAPPTDDAAIEAPRPNILLIYADDHAQNAVSAYGSGLNRTPNIDRLADEGTRFLNSFVGNSICAPSRATILTGKHSHAHGVIANGIEFDSSQTTFPELLQGAGYQTVLLGKWHLKSDPTGFDDWRILDGQGPYYNPVIIAADGRRRVTGYTTEIITEFALDWLSTKRDVSRPFLLMVQHKAPHRNWQPGPSELHLFDGMSFVEPPTLFDDYSNRAPGAATQEMSIAGHMTAHDLKLVEPGGLTDGQLAAWRAAYGPRNAAFDAAALEGEALVRWSYQRYIKDYLRCIVAIDTGVGQILDRIDELGLTENTIVIYTSDQGFYLGEHGWYDKRWMYEESLRTPMIVRWPQTIVAGSEIDALVQNIDVAPTLLDLAGVRAPSDMHGRSLVPLLLGHTPSDWRRSIYYHYYEFPGTHAVPRHHGVRTERYKLIRYEQLDEWELFDLEADPAEQRSVADDPAYDDVRAELETELVRLRELYGDAF